MGTQQELQGFLRQHKDAWQFASKASDDYLLARCGILNVLWSGFEMATQASEKLLKAYLLFADRSFSCNAEKVRKAVARKSQSLGRTHELGHDVEACLELATEAGFVCSTGLRSRLARINAYYSRRYPGGGPTSLSAGEFEDVDEAVFEIWDAFKGIHDDYYYVTGLMSPVYGVYLHRYAHGGSVHPISRNPLRVMTIKNTAFHDRRTDLVNGILKRLTVWYPRK